MMRKVFFILLISFVVKIHAQTWQVKNSGVNVTLQDICFVDTLHGWAVGDNATILLTNDGGENWIKLLSPLEFIALKKVQFVSETVGFIISTGGSFLSTTDGGINWNISSILADSTGF
ncbi:MAG: YCF48-related protein, partial [Bacteroidetes bacterium]|nr:YCF48-related protein [Bacteroidota bacterium]